jgi:hypothetical protein
MGHGEANGKRKATAARPFLPYPSCEYLEYSTEKIVKAGRLTNIEVKLCITRQVS